MGEEVGKDIWEMVLRDRGRDNYCVYVQKRCTEKAERGDGKMRRKGEDREEENTKKRKRIKGGRFGTKRRTHRKNDRKQHHRVNEKQFKYRSAPL